MPVLRRVILIITLRFWVIVPVLQVRKWRPNVTQLASGAGDSGPGLCKALTFPDTCCLLQELLVSGTLLTPTAAARWGLSCEGR